MNKTLLIFKHEFLHTIKRKGFIILTLALPVLALLGIGIFRIASGVVKPPAEVTRIGYVDEVGGFDRFTTQGNISLVRFDTTAAATQALIEKNITEYFVIPPDFDTTGIINRYTIQKELAPPDATVTAIKNFISSNLLMGKVSDTTITLVEKPLNLVTTTLTATGVWPAASGICESIVPGVFSFLMALSLIFSATYVIQSLSEEKENRADGDIIVLGLDPAITHRQGFGAWYRRARTGNCLGDIIAALTEPGLFIYRGFHQYYTCTR